MRITHVITRLVVGGAQENTLTTIKGLQNAPDVRVSLISGPTTGAEGSLEPQVLQMGIPFERVPELVRPVHPLKDLMALRKLTGIFCRTQPELVHTHSGKAGVLGRLAAAKAGIPLILHHIHGPSFGPFQSAVSNWVFRSAERYAARVTTHFACSAHAMTQLYLEAGIGRPENYTRVFSGFELNPFLQATQDPVLRSHLGLPPNAFVIGKVARIAPLKGHADALDTLRQLLPFVPEARVLFVGDGILRQKIEQCATTMGLRDKVVFTGLLPPDAVPRHIGIMDCLVHLSRREALSRALPQALAAGKPVIAYDFDGADEVCLHQETGFLVRTGDTATVMRHLRQLAHDAQLRRQLGENGRAFVRHHFSSEQLVNTLLELYRRLGAERRIA